MTDAERYAELTKDARPYCVVGRGFVPRYDPNAKLVIEYRRQTVSEVQHMNEEKGRWEEGKDPSPVIRAKFAEAARQIEQDVARHEDKPVFGVSDLRSAASPVSKLFRSRDVIVRQWLEVWQQGFVATFEEMLVRLVIDLAENRELLVKEVVELRAKSFPSPKSEG